MKTVATNHAPAALGPYAQAQVSGGFVFTSGQIGIDPATGVIPDGIEAQAHQVFRNLTAVLQAAGSDMSKAVKTTVFIKNMDDFATVNTIYAGISPEPPPGQKLRRGRAPAQGRARRVRGHRRGVSARAVHFSPVLVEFSATCCPVCAY